MDDAAYAAGKRARIVETLARRGLDVDVAAPIRIAPGTRRRVRLGARATKSGVILGFNVKLNYTMLGFTMHKVFMKLTSISKEDLDSLIGQLRQRSNVVCISKSIGFSDLDFECMVRSS